MINSLLEHESIKVKVENDGEDVQVTSSGTDVFYIIKEEKDIVKREDVEPDEADDDSEDDDGDIKPEMTNTDEESEDDDDEEMECDSIEIKEETTVRDQGPELEVLRVESPPRLRRTSRRTTINFVGNKRVRRIVRNKSKRKKEDSKMAIANNADYVNFIKKYKNLRELWDISSEKYKNKNLRKRAYEQLKREYANIDVNATVDTVKNRIKNMRTAYRRELKKKIHSERSGDDRYQPSLWYFDALDFLRDFEKPEHRANNTVISSGDECASRSPTTSTNKQRGSQSCERNNELLQKATRLIETFSQKEERDEAIIYAEAWACSYRKLSVEEKLFAKKACDEIFILGQLQKLTLNTVQTQASTCPS